MTVRQAVTRLTELGLVKADVDPGELFDLDAALTHECGETIPDAITTLLIALDAAIVIDGDGYGSDSDDYEEVFATITQCAGSGLDITDVKFDDTQRLHFVVNGAHRTWQPEYVSEGRIDVLCFVESISDLTPNDSRRWASVQNEDVMAGSFILGQPDTLEHLTVEFGLDLHVH